ncbi:MAG: hypothetical protein Kow0069_05900 [Promethearchaeota archaeon]
MGLSHPADAHHARSVEILEALKNGSFGHAYTSDQVMCEAATLAAARSRGHLEVIRHVRRLFTGDLKFAKMLNVDDATLRRAWDLFEKVNEDRPRRPMSFVDCCTIVLCKMRRIESLVSFDEHFDGWIVRVS